LRTGPSCKWEECTEFAAKPLNPATRTAEKCSPPCPPTAIGHVLNMNLGKQRARDTDDTCHLLAPLRSYSLLVGIQYYRRQEISNEIERRK
jgi:hypothetical protein